MVNRPDCLQSWKDGTTWEAKRGLGSLGASRSSLSGLPEYRLICKELGALITKNQKSDLLHRLVTAYPFPCPCD